MNTDDILNTLDTIAIPPPPGSAPHAASRNTPGETWSWLWKDTLSRVVPFALAGGWYLRRARLRGAHSPITRGELVGDIALGVAVGAPLAAIAGTFRAWVAPGYRLPTAADQALQTAFYFAVNAPAEEMFWRGMVQSAAVNGLHRAPKLQRAAPVLGWAVATSAFGAYHRLGRWSWRSIAGVTLAGGLFGALYQFRPRSGRLVAPIIAHGFATAGFLSWGDAFLHLWTRRRNSHRHG